MGRPSPADPARIPPASGWRALLWAAPAYVLLLLAIQATTGSFWETNDDPAMMLYLHGFGLSGQPSPVLLFSNLWQGRLMTALGSPFGRTGYGVYVMAMQVLAMTAAASLLSRLNGRVALNVLLIGVIGLRPLMAPQFTMTAGFLCIAGVLAFRAHGDRPHPALPLLGAALILLGVLMREQIALVLAPAALPALWHDRLVRSAWTWVAVGLLVCLAVLAHLDHAAMLLRPEWTAFRELNLLRAAFTDYGIGVRVAESPAALAAAGWSANDVSMVQLFWLFDPQLASPARLRAAIDAVGGAQAGLALDQARLMPLGREFLRLDMLALLLACLACLPFLARGELWRLALVALALAAAALLVAALGRSNVNYVFQPMLALLAVLALARVPQRARAAPWLVAAGAAACGMILATQIPLTQAHHRIAADGRAFAAALDGELLHFAWGWALPLESLYPPLGRREDMPSLRMYGLGTHQLSPMAAAQLGGDPSGGVRMLLSPEGIPLIFAPSFLPFLETYCRERFDGRLTLEPRAAAGGARAATVRCEAVPG